MADRNILYRLRAALAGGKVAVASEVELETDSNAVPNSIDNVQNGIESLQTEIAAIVSPATVSLRGFRIFNGGTLVSNVGVRIEEIIIDAANLSDWEDVNSIYAARNDKIVDVRLPTDAEIVAAGETYPITIEITHLAGLSRLRNNNLVRFRTKDADTALINTVSLGLRDNTTLLQNDRVVLVKNASGQNWQESRATTNPSENLLPDGVFDLQNDTTISDIDNITTDLAGLIIESGQAFQVLGAGTRFGVDIQVNDVIVAITDNPSLATDSEDWLLIRNTNNEALSMSSLQLLSQFMQDGIRFDASRNVFVNESNVIRVNGFASGLPVTRSFFTTTGTGTTARSQVFANEAFQFTDLVGGTMTLEVSFSTASSQGSLPELTSLTFTYGSTNFVFPLDGIVLDGSTATISIGIPNDDYTAILNTNCTVTLDYNFRGVGFIGAIVINSLVNSLDGTLRAAVTDIANESASFVRMQINADIADLGDEIDRDGAALAAIQPRISPYKNVVTENPDINARFLDSTGSDNFPTTIASMSAVSAGNPRFAGGDVALFVAVISPGEYRLQNITQSTEIVLDDATANVELGESLTFNNQSYFVYRVSALTSGDVYEVVTVASEQVVAWPDDIRNLQDDIGRIDAELGHAALDLSDALIDVLDNEVSVIEESNPTIVATDYNNGLGGTGTQSVFYEPNPNSPSSGSISSQPFNLLTGDQVRRKLAYLPPGVAYTNQRYVWAFDGTEARDLVVYRDGMFYAQVFVPAIPAGTRTETVYPAPATRASGAGIWQTIEALTFSGGVPVAEANELFFTRQLPNTSSTLTIDYRGHANGNVFGASSTTLAGVGGSTEVSTTFTLNDGSEQVTVEIRWYPNNRQLRASITERVNSGLPTVNDVQLILSFDESRTVPATPATTREVALEHETEGYQIFAVKPSSAGNLILVGDTQEVDTGYAYTTLFNASETGHLTVGEETATFLNYEDFEPISTTVTDLENHATLPQFGLFTTQYTHETIVRFDTQMQARNSENDLVNLGEELVMVSPNGTRYRLSVDDTGNLTTTVET